MGVSLRYQLYVVVSQKKKYILHLPTRSPRGGCGPYTFFGGVNDFLENNDGFWLFLVIFFS